MIFRKLSLSAVTLAALVPSLSFAGAEEHALHACVNAFASTLSSNAAPIVKLNYSRGASSPMSDYYAHEYTFTLHANDPKTNARLSSVSCSATQQGTVLALRTIQTPGDGVKFAAR
jgi:hypothetical protein